MEYVAFHTSGSSSSPKEIIKSGETLAREVEYHRGRMARLVHESTPLRFIATVEDRHLYGTLWRKMLPAAMGCEVYSGVVLSPEELIAAMHDAARVMLITTPSFLKRFCAYADLYDVPRNVVEIVSSGALLDHSTSMAAKRVFGVAPLEIFGSTETGGVASRRQSETDAGKCEWEVFEPVKIASSDDGRLQVVESPFSFQANYTMGDGVEIMPDGRHFRLLARRDRIVKIAEKRVDLAEMEMAMSGLGGIREAALVTLDGEMGPCLGAVICGEECGALEMRLRLKNLFPQGTIPKKFRYVEELPRNPQGKVTVEALRGLFSHG